MLLRENLEQLERETLAPCAALSAETKGRDHPVSPDSLRTEYQRDRDRIIHSAAFRKLEYKTQVYVIHEGDYYRTRLTHTIEVAQIARTLARSLSLNPDLTEAIALAHDLGHTPFGHSGERALHRLLEGEGGFEHNRQGVRVVEKLEERYKDFPGLNLTWEVREGIAKHKTSYDAPRIDRFEPDRPPSLEAQLVDAADEIAFNHHDLDDALKMGIVKRADLEQVPWIHAACREEAARSGAKPYEMDNPLRFRLLGRLFDMAVFDVLDQTEKNIAGAAVDSLQSVRGQDKRLVGFSPEGLERNRLLRGFLLENVYRHPLVVRMATKAEGFIDRLFNLYRSTPAQLPLECRSRLESDGLARVIADYISSMTDHYCLEEYKRAFLPQISI